MELIWCEYVLVVAGEDSGKDAPMLSSIVPRQAAHVGSAQESSEIQVDPTSKVGDPKGRTPRRSRAHQPPAAPASLTQQAGAGDAVPAHVDLILGRAVVLRDLQDRNELHCVAGCLREFDEGGGRWAVQ